jgi:hypothetical protein
MHSPNIKIYDYLYIGWVHPVEHVTMHEYNNPLSTTILSERRIVVLIHHYSFIYDYIKKIISECMVYDIRDYWFFGRCPSSCIQRNTKEHKRMFPSSGEGLGEAWRRKRSNFCNVVFFTLPDNGQREINAHSYSVNTSLAHIFNSTVSTGFRTPYLQRSATEYSSTSHP